MVRALPGTTRPNCGQASVRLNSLQLNVLGPPHKYPFRGPVADCSLTTPPLPPLHKGGGKVALILIA